MCYNKLKSDRHERFCFMELHTRFPSFFVANITCGFILSLSIVTVNRKSLCLAFLLYLYRKVVTVMYKSSDIAVKIKYKVRDKGISQKKMFAELGISENTLTNFKTSMPKVDTVAKIADYLDCSVDYLLGREPMEQPSSVKSIGDNNNTAVIGDNNVVGCTLSVDEQQLLELFRSLGIIKKMQVVSLIYNLSKEL